MTASVQVGVDAAVINSDTPELVKARLSYNESTTDWQLGKGDGPYTYTWTIYDLQKSIDTDYTASVEYNDGSSEQIVWTQPGLNASDDDIVVFKPAAENIWHTLSDLLQLVALRGWSTVVEWEQIKRMIALSSEFNTIKWEDGR